MMLSALALLAALSLSDGRTDSLRSDGDVREVAMRHTSDVQRCYVIEGLKRNPTLLGTLEVELTILPTGVVDSTVIGASSMRGPDTEEVAQCLTRVTRNWRFSRGPYQVETVVFPFRFSPESPYQVRPASS